MKKTLSLLFALFCGCTALITVSRHPGTKPSPFTISAQQPDTLWFKYNDRFIAHNYIPLSDVDSVQFVNIGPRLWKTSQETGKPLYFPRTYFADGFYYLEWPGRYLSKPNTYSACDYTSTNSQWSLERSMESEHFIRF